MVNCGFLQRLGPCQLLFAKLSSVCVGRCLRLSARACVTVLEKYQVQKEICPAAERTERRREKRREREREREREMSAG